MNPNPHPDPQRTAAVAPAGLLPGLAALAGNGLGLLVSRLELAALELGEVRSQLLRLALVFALAIVLLLFAVGYGTVLVVYLTWNALGWPVLLILALGLAGAGGALLHYARTMTRRGRLSLPSTMAELKADRNALRLP